MPMLNPVNSVMKPLLVYKASAGSGKTFTLAVEYIKLLIANPYAYRNILAVTFTNKATAEMKVRILGQLNGIAKGLKDSNDYLDKVKEAPEIQALGFSDREIRRRAQMALSAMLHASALPPLTPSFKASCANWRTNSTLLPICA